MTSGVVSHPSDTKSRVLILNEDTQGEDLIVQEVPYDASDFPGATGQASTKLNDWLVANTKCPCTPRRRAEEELAKKIEELGRSNRELEQFAFVAAHDLQEPLRMVAAYTRLLAEKYRGRLDADADRYIAHASEGAQRLQTLIQDLLSYSRVGRSETACKEVDSNFALADATKNLSHSISETGAVIDAAPLPTVAADRPRLTQVFQNLVGNAIKFRGEQAPRISIGAARTEDNCWQFSVRDNGIGIGQEHAEAVFAVFHRLHTRAEYPGNGIGLAICKRIVEGLGGRIWLESRPGEGTTCKFTLPAVDSDEKGGAS
jgi:light-regulated signal transduction histidine kinase (bacteriophytochrome)